MTSDFLKLQSSELVVALYSVPVWFLLRFQTKFTEYEMGQNFNAQYYHLANKFLGGLTVKNPDKFFTANCLVLFVI